MRLDLEKSLLRTRTAETFLVLPQRGEKGEQLHGRAQGQRAFSASEQAPQQFATYVLPSEKKDKKQTQG